MELIERVNGHFLESMAAKQLAMQVLPGTIAQAAESMVACLMNEGKILACGNGGSAADAQHFAAEMVGRFEKERPGLAALSLATDTSALTAIGNDYDFERVFSKQVRALGQDGDLLLALSTSGNSLNVIEAIHAAHERQMGVIALTGRDGGQIADLMTADDKDMFNGSPDRYDWKLLGKREIYIPYNNYQLSSPDVSYDQLIKPGHLDPQFTRHELHRVWVVEGTLKPGARHIYGKRTLYLDEDSWQVALADQYDSRGELWRVSVAYLKNYYELPTTWSALDVFHDLQSGRYYVQNLDNEESGTSDFGQPLPDANHFSVATLRRVGTR